MSQQSPEQKPPQQLRFAKIFLSIDCPECGDELEGEIELKVGKNAPVEKLCEWCTEKLKVPEIWVKG